MFGRLRCHGCGKRSKYSKGTTEFQCDDCGYANYLNSRGELISPPQNLTNPHTQPAQAQGPFSTFTQPLSSEVPTRADDIFCARCLHNQRVYTEAVSNYLPDEDHPRYQEYEDTFDKFKADLENKYPMVCKKCAPKVQQKIHRADYYGKSQQFAASMTATRERSGKSPIGLRDDWGKWRMRMLLKMLGLVVYASLFAQIAWHMTGIIATYLAPQPMNEFDAPDIATGTTYTRCMAEYKALTFDMACHQTFSSFVPITLLINLGMIWYNHGLQDWYNDTYRMEAINGQAEHFRIQLLLLLVRGIGWYKLSDPWVLADLGTFQQIAAHGFMVVFMVLAQYLSERPIKAEKWRIQGKMMPRPEEVDVFSATAGPAEEQYQRQASSVPPLRLFARNDKPFPIEKLNPMPPRGYSRLNLPTEPPPSPPESQSPTDDDAMDIDWEAKARPRIKSTYNYGASQGLGWTGMRNEIFGIEDKARADEERRRGEAEERAKLKYQPPVDPSPFQGRLPQAPMSMERKLRNPVTQVQFKAQPLSKRQDFMKQMSQGIEQARYSGKSNQDKKEDTADLRSTLDFDEDFSPVKSRTRGPPSVEDATPAKGRTKGSLDLYDSGWRLKSDYSKDTGLEDLFAGRSFTINDMNETRTVAEEQRRPIPLPPAWLVVVAVFGFIGASAWSMQPIRRAICHWLIRQMGLEDVPV